MQAGSGGRGGAPTAPPADTPRPADVPSTNGASGSNPNLVYYDDGQVRHFDNKVENALERLTRQGARITTIPSVNLPQEEIVEYLRKPVDIFEDDDEETAKAKERTAEFKAEALKFIESGGTFNQFLRDLAAHANELAGTRQDVHDEAVRLADTEGREACEAYLEKMNPELEALGIKPVKFAPMFYEMRAKRLARQREPEQSKEK